MSAQLRQAFRLYWLREDGSHAGTVVPADQLEPSIRARVLDLANGEAGEFAVRLPFFDKHDWRKRDKILTRFAWKRKGSAIVGSVPVTWAIRDRAAQLALTHPTWKLAPAERGRAYFPTWRAISIKLQGLLRHSIADAYFRDIHRFEDRELAYPMLAYKVARLFYGRPSTEFTYDLRDYPECQHTLRSTWRSTGHTMQILLADSEQRLQAAGMPVLARRYAPVWRQDVLAAVRQAPRRYVDLLAREGVFINAIIDLGTARSVAAVNRFARAASLALRKVHGMDVRRLALACLDETTRMLGECSAAWAGDSIARADGGGHLYRQFVPPERSA